MNDVKYIKNGDILKYRGKYYTVTQIATYDYDDENDTMSIEASNISELVELNE